MPRKRYSSPRPALPRQSIDVWRSAVDSVSAEGPKHFDLHVIIEYKPEKAARFRALPQQEQVVDQARKDLNVLGLSFPKTQNIRRVLGDLLYLFWLDSACKNGLHKLRQSYQSAAMLTVSKSKKRDSVDILTIVVTQVDAGKPFDVHSILNDSPELQPLDPQSEQPRLESPLSLLLSPAPSRPWWVPDDQSPDYVPPLDIPNSPRASSPEVQSPPELLGATSIRIQSGQAFVGQQPASASRVAVHAQVANPSTSFPRYKSPSIEPGEVSEMLITPSMCHAGTQTSPSSSRYPQILCEFGNEPLRHNPEIGFETFPYPRPAGDPCASSCDTLLDSGDTLSMFVPPTDESTKEAKETIDQLVRQFQEAQEEVQMAQVRSRRLARQLERLGARKSTFPVGERQRACECDASDTSEALRVERRRRIRAEQALAEVSAERQAPFIVPALLEAFKEISALREADTFLNNVES
ncbi:hypothetical protein CONPUDRAFT_140014 [Coniophora puteana RWD-64-598 SS2]|uniref:Uncharacterized protein n=1 Tax=Coniophora puteana (strain RWD-64-598) TaxID=741705 RepID=A0A5M3MA86_CONPW|nr:uncharacterized protein CONPUDRAFT_140014 [Coniophora puteana RWD-64-598 SS2]EIW75561.1 hypothetical protein CONPUDRAFT_140014 [Coniophora puteana RWD-64-598 SS2]